MGRGERECAWWRLRLGGTLLKNIFGFHGMIGTSGTKMEIFFNLTKLHLTVSQSLLAQEFLNMGIS